MTGKGTVSGIYLEMKIKFSGIQSFSHITLSSTEPRCPGKSGAA